MPIFTGIAMASSGITLMARILGNNGRPITRASLSAIAYTVRNITDSTTEGTGSLTISAVVYDSLQQSDPRWTKDSASLPGRDGAWGYNFLATLAASLFADGGDRIQIDIKFTPTSGEAFIQPFQITPTVVYAS